MVNYKPLHEWKETALSHATFDKKQDKQTCILEYEPKAPGLRLKRKMMMKHWLRNCKNNFTFMSRFIQYLVQDTLEIYDSNDASIGAIFGSASDDHNLDPDHF